MLNPVIDYLTFTVKSDSKSSVPAIVDRDFIFSLLHMSETDFIDIGKRGFYAHCFVANSITVYESYPDRMFDMGYCVSMSGDGCRYFESYQKDGEVSADVWREYFSMLRSLSSVGYAVNFSRIDIAVDDYDYELDMGQIESTIRRGEIVSQFRKGRKIDNITVDFHKGILNDTGFTINVGSRKSATFCRFYDKLEEQKSKHQNDIDKLNELEKIDHWVRMEFEFKREQAIKIVNIICDSDCFGELFAEIVNGYIRFVDIDNENVSRRTTKKWWSDFVGTLKRLKLSVGDFKSYSYDRVLNYYDKYLSTTIFTVLSRMSPDDFLARTFKNAVSRLKTKHKAIINKDVHCTYDLTNCQMWDFLNPLPPDMRSAYCYG